MTPTSAAKIYWFEKKVLLNTSQFIYLSSQLMLNKNNPFLVIIKTSNICT